MSWGKSPGVQFWLARALSRVPALRNRRARAQAGEFKLKYGNDLPATHPINKRATEACDAIRAATNGRVDISDLPDQRARRLDRHAEPSALGRAWTFLTVGSPLANLIPVSAIPSIAFAFPNFDGVWAAVDGDLGAHIRQQVGTIGLVAFDKMWDNGFRQITTSTKPINTPGRSQGHEAARAGEPAVHLDV